MINTLPRSTHTLILGGGAAGCVVAGLMAERSEEPIVLLEAGPDYGAPSDWPEDLTSAANLPATHSWEYTDTQSIPGRSIALPRGKVIGGSSSINGCAAIWGHRADYDGWAALGLDGWSADALRPLFAEVQRRLRATPYPTEALTPFQDAFLAAAIAAGIPLTNDLNDLDAGAGVAPAPFNVSDGIRWNAAFAYLEPLRDRPYLMRRGNVLVDRVLLAHGRAVGAVVIHDGVQHTIQAERIILTAGAYGSPAILLRSGIGDPAELARHGIAVAHALPGVGRNLHDHPAIELTYDGSAALDARMQAFAARRFAPAEQVIAKACSPAGAAPFDLHIYPVGGFLHAGGGSTWHLPVAVMTPVSRGELTLASADPTIAPIIRHGYLADAEGRDLRILADGVDLVRRIARQEPLAALLGNESAASRSIVGRVEVEAYLRQSCFHYYHPVGTCAMGTAGDADAVVDARGAVHGLTGLYVADASVMPIIPRANTNVPTAVVASRIAGWLAGVDG